MCPAPTRSRIAWATVLLPDAVTPAIPITRGAGAPRMRAILRQDPPDGETVRRSSGATSGIRTHDLTFTKRPLCQLSYGGVCATGDDRRPTRGRRGRYRGGESLARKAFS